ncbi:MAG: transposase domain-containing protein, partial [Terriglobia bacterium]
MADGKLATLTRKVEELEVENKELRNENASIRERLAWLLRQVFGTKSEKAPQPEQPQLFDVAGDHEESTGGQAEVQPTVAVQAHQRVKATRKALPEWVERREVLIDIDEAEKQCACGQELKRIGEEIS